MVATDVRDVADEEEVDKDDMEDFVSCRILCHAVSERCTLTTPVQLFHYPVNNLRYQRYNSIFRNRATCSEC